MGNGPKVSALGLVFSLLSRSNKILPCEKSERYENQRVKTPSDVWKPESRRQMGRAKD